MGVIPWLFFLHRLLGSRLGGLVIFVLKYEGNDEEIVIAKKVAELKSLRYGMVSSCKNV